MKVELSPANWFLDNNSNFHNNSISDYGRLTEKKTRTNIIRKSLFFSLHKMNSIHPHHPSLKNMRFSHSWIRKWFKKSCFKLKAPHHHDVNFFQLPSDSWSIVISLPSNQWVVKMFISIRLILYDATLVNRNIGACIVCWIIRPSSRPTNLARAREWNHSTFIS